MSVRHFKAIHPIVQSGTRKDGSTGHIATPTAMDVSRRTGYRVERFIPIKASQIQVTEILASCLCSCNTRLKPYHEYEKYLSLVRGSISSQITARVLSCILISCSCHVSDDFDLSHLFSTVV